MTDTSRLVTLLNERGASRVALQFPAGLKRQAGEIAGTLRAAGFFVVISGDPCYGACDLALDTLSFADVLVHFGHTPLGTHPDVIFLPWEVDIPLESLDHAIPLLRESLVGLVTTSQHAHQLPRVAEYLGDRGIEARIGEVSERTPLPGQILGCSYSAARVPGVKEILYIGTGVFHPLGVQLATGARVVALDPFTGTSAVIDASRLLRTRHALIERARRADRFGILVSTKTGQCRRELAERLAGLCDRAFLVVAREIDPGELLNLGFGAYVNTACPRLSYDDQVRFPVPVLTPQEFEILCGVRQWEDYAIDEV
ncbi:2-(3-amino-3-carboxypropyl)histidine synthase [Methanolinea mesophila]|uniref:diphthamide biosynthesis enzyme Dph2 n=1 Tax=Methanolinea mesophila TaxID=547055 RepID=UPI001AE52378|nr:diphthamide biosynthesis enzyme Dph2 [Methanolinea mesophila]MBP1929530.1 2-(3-amino-3-carboxypropyl)histidine synthase [Methanolinea mesophila]